MRARSIPILSCLAFLACSVASLAQEASMTAGRVLQDPDDVMRVALEESASVKRTAHQIAGLPGAGRLAELAARLHDDLVSRADKVRLADDLRELGSTLRAIEGSGTAASASEDVWHQISNLRWNVRKIGRLLEVDMPDTFFVGPVGDQQAGKCVSALDELVSRTATIGGALATGGDDAVYRNLLIEQMEAIAGHARTVRTAATASTPWWTFDSNQAVTAILRLVALTKRETKGLTPELEALLEQVWDASEGLCAAVNRIEDGARDAGPDAVIIYRPRNERRGD
jgi:hypothetical protein